MIRLLLTDDQAANLADALSYYELSDYGCGEQRPLSEEQEEHVRQIKALQEKLDRSLKS